MIDVSQTELSQLCAARAHMYALLARLWREEPDADLLQRLGQLEAPADIDSPEILEGIARLKAHSAEGSEQALLDDLAREYARLLLGAGRTEAAFPYESVYTSAERLLMQDARDAVVEFYRAEGLQRARPLAEPEDHLAFELEFMAYLCAKAGEALQGNDDCSALDYFTKQQEFMTAHLLAWMPEFCNDVLRLARLDFYKGAAQLTSTFVAMDERLVSTFLHKVIEWRT